MDLGAHHYVDGTRQQQGAALRELGSAAVTVCTASDAKSIAEGMEREGSQGKLLVLTRESFEEYLLLGDPCTEVVQL